MKKEYRDKKVKGGMCPSCGARPPAEGKKSCQKCLDRATENARRRRRDRKEDVNKIIKNWRDKNKKRNKEIFRRHYDKLKEAVFDHYGRECVCCGEGFEFLILDHINGDGTKHRQSVLNGRKAGGPAFYRWVIKNDFPDDLQPLCMNCNWAKWKYGECPHQFDIG